MPPNSTQNLNAKLTQVVRQGHGDPAPRFAPRPSGDSASQTKIVTGTSPYRGGYHLNV